MAQHSHAGSSTHSIRSESDSLPAGMHTHTAAWRTQRRVRSRGRMQARGTRTPDAGRGQARTSSRARGTAHGHMRTARRGSGGRPPACTLRLVGLARFFSRPARLRLPTSHPTLLLRDPSPRSTLAALLKNSPPLVSAVTVIKQCTRERCLSVCPAGLPPLCWRHRHDASPQRKNSCSLALAKTTTMRRTQTQRLRRSPQK